MARLDVPIKVQMGCDDCHRFLLKTTAEHKAEVNRLREDIDVVIYHAENLQRIIAGKPVRDLTESKMAFENAKRATSREEEQ